MLIFGFTMFFLFFSGLFPGLEAEIRCLWLRGANPGPGTRISDAGREEGDATARDDSDSPKRPERNVK